MTPARNKAALQGQSGIATKVYDATPIQEAWTSSRICGQIAKSSNADLNIVRGCLNTLIDSGLVREPQPDHFQRVPVREEARKEPATQDRPTLTLAHAHDHASASPPASSIDVLAAIAQQLRDMCKQLAAVASELESAALSIEEKASASENDPELVKLRQLQALLKSLS